MKVTLKTLQQKSFVVEIDDSETVLALKEKIQAEQGAGFPVEGLKLIYSGKILNDANKISEYKILESNFVVVMVTKGKPQPAKPQATPPTTSAATPSTTTPTPNTATASDTRPPVSDTKPQQETTPTTSEQQSSVVTPMEQSSTTPAATEPGSMEAAASVLVTGSAYESAIEQLTNMGYTREQAMRAMQASYNNPDRAAEYLLEGKADQLIAEEESRQQEEIRRQQQELQQQQQGVGGSGGQQEAVRGGEEGSEQQQPQVPPAIPGGGNPLAGGGNPLAFISQTPQFQHLREQLQQNPAMLPHFLQQLSQQNPLLFQAIAQNQGEFLRMVNEGGQPLPGGAGGGPPGVPPGTVQIPVTPQEKEAIERLKELGFPEEDVIQAYFACEKNEELAANFLFHNNF